MKTLLCILALALTAQAQQPIAVSVPRDAAIRYLHGQCVPRLTPWDGQPRQGHILLILRRESLQDGQAVANPLASALAAHRPYSYHVGPIPDTHDHVGQGLDDEGNRGVLLIAPKLRPVEFCK